MSTAESWRSSRAKRVQASLISSLGYPVIAALASTYRWRQEGLQHLDEVKRSGRQPIMAFWHGRILPSTYFFRRRGIVVITSENFDGEWIAGIIERFGYGTARGSTSRGGGQGAGAAEARHGGGEAGGVHARRSARARERRAAGRDLAREGDRQSGAAVSPRSQPSLDAEELGPHADPKPFSDVAISIGEPIEVPPDADEAGIEQVRLALKSN